MFNSFFSFFNFEITSTNFITIVNINGINPIIETILLIDIISFIILTYVEYKFMLTKFPTINITETINEYIKYYNNERLAYSLQYKSPVQYRTELSFN